ncbi:MAG: lactate dehydrogenase, partial [Frankiales bacterium]|nr:lactate dehydrogenase [Frankiales bacterium]
MSNNGNSKLAIIGAGSVGSSLAYAALIRGSVREVALIDVQEARARAEALDLEHGLQFLDPATVTGGSDPSLVTGADVVVITAGAQMGPGERRLDLAARNAAILETMLPPLVERAPDAVYVLVTNPCDVLTVVAQRITGLPASRIFASGTVLDSSRLRSALAARLQIAPSSVHAFIVGEHGDTEFPLWSHATAGATPLEVWRDPDGSPVTRVELDTLARDVMEAGFTVIAGKGTSNFAIGLSCSRIVEAVLRNEHAVLPVSSVLQGLHGISGVALSVPSVVGAGGVIRVLDTPMT